MAKKAKAVKKAATHRSLFVAVVDEGDYGLTYGYGDSAEEAKYDCEGNISGESAPIKIVEIKVPVKKAVKESKAVVAQTVTL